MLNVGQFRQLIVMPALKAINLWSLAAEDLVFGTALIESKLTYLHQIKGPALGLFQMEPRTHDDIWKNFICKDAGLYSLMSKMMNDSNCDATKMVWNLYYAASMCRMHYLRVKEPLPIAGNIIGYANYWKKYYNTELGAGNPSTFVTVWNLNASTA